MTDQTVLDLSPRPIRGHSHNWKGGRVDQGRYMRLYAPEHPRASVLGYVYEHVLVAERALGRSFPADACIHHVNGDGYDNRPQNLVVCENQSYHVLLHQRERSLKACGNADWIRCNICKQYDHRERLYIRPGLNHGYHRRCARQRWLEQAARS